MKHHIAVSENPLVVVDCDNTDALIRLLCSAAPMIKSTISVTLPYDLWLTLRARAEEQNQPIEEYCAALLEAATLPTTEEE